MPNHKLLPCCVLLYVVKYTSGSSYINLLRSRPLRRTCSAYRPHLSALLSPQLPTRKLFVGEKILPEVLCFLCFLRRSFFVSPPIFFVVSRFSSYANECYPPVKEEAALLVALTNQAPKFTVLLYQSMYVLKAQENSLQSALHRAAEFIR